MGNICCKEADPDFSEPVSLAHFQILRCIGRGAFGRVRIVEHRGPDRQQYALKYINKQRCLQQRAVDNVVQERRILEYLIKSHPCIVNLHYAFQDDENLFMVLDLMLGGDLRFHLERSGPFPEAAVRQYAVSISLALHFLHAYAGIIHRDIKPDNCLLTGNGCLKLSDMNIAARLRQGRGGLTSVAGSLAYMAPEQQIKPTEPPLGYGFSVDWWSLGVTLYELLYGRRPFHGRTNDDLARCISDPAASTRLKFPNTPIVSPAAQDFIRRLLTHDPRLRLGHLHGAFRLLQAHPWFSEINWQKAIELDYSPVFVPDGRHSNFDATHELEELLLEESPLR
ncbi:kinase-like protein, partial [Ramicandelaber brevisporus]